ncbi:hypothetical protein HPP92_011019 [Vanilla planifolia]|uniref:Acyl-CoA-binding domain-containing protein n=1 Tax=Vanilla planifolia TaxID=51239 RepID=A0A835V418_VANPL|nr:hypothetical protein HPP92_011019 [Vanilla planifolia]
MDNVDSGHLNMRVEESGEHVIAVLKAEKEELDAVLNKEQLHNLQQAKSYLRQRLGMSFNLYIGQLAAEQSRRCLFAYEKRITPGYERKTTKEANALSSIEHYYSTFMVDLAELRQKLQNMETLQKEVELLQRQKAASEQLVSFA